MATRTVSAAGGNFNATGTWVGGVVPVAADDIVADGTSGNLTLMGNTPNLIGANFTGYTGTVALATFQFNFAGGSILTLSSGMTVTNTSNGGRFQWPGSAIISMTGGGICRVPNISPGSQLNITGSGELYLAGNNSTTTTTGNNFTWYGTTSPGNLMTVTAPQFCFIRPDTTLTLSNSLPFSRMVFDTTASITTTGSILSTFGVATYIRFDKTPSFSAGVPLSYLISAPALTHTIDVATSSVRINRLNIGFNSGNLTNSFFFPTNTSIGKMLFRPYFSTSSDGTRHTAQLISSSNISIDELVVGSDYGSFTGTNAEPASQVITTNARLSTLRLSAGATFSIGSISCSGVSPTGVSTPVTIFSSMTASVPATISIGGTFSFDNTQIIDINNIGTPAYAFTFSNNTITRTTGITSSFPTTGGGSGGSFTFVN